MFKVETSPIKEKLIVPPILIDYQSWDFFSICCSYLQNKIFPIQFQTIVLKMSRKFQ